MLNSAIQKVFIIQQNNSIYFVASNMSAAYNFLANNINPIDKKLLKSYKQYTIDFRKSDTLFIPSNCGQNFQFKREKLFTRYNTANSNSKLLKSA